MTYDLLDLKVAPAEDAVALDAPWTHDRIGRVGGWRTCSVPLPTADARVLCSQIPSQMRGMLRARRDAPPRVPCAKSSICSID